MTIPYELNKVHCGDALTILRDMPDNTIDCCVTSPPYWGLRDYGVEGQLGLEPTPELYVENMLAIFTEVKRIMKPEGTLWLNLGDSYVSAKSRYSSGQQTISGKDRNEPNNGNRPDLKNHPTLKDKDLAGIPWRVAFALQASGWWLRQDIIWHKPNPMPESVQDRCTKAHEYIFLLTKSARYYWNADAIAEDSVDPESYTGRRKRNPDAFVSSQKFNTYRSGFQKLDGQIYEKRNARSVWSITPKANPAAHFATFPQEIPKRCILAGCPNDGTVLDPFAGSGTTLFVARELCRNYIGIELNPDYISIINQRLGQQTLFGEQQ